MSEEKAVAAVSAASIDHMNKFGELDPDSAASADPLDGEDDSFWVGLLPKEETQVLSFLEEHPTWDGRGIKIAVLDTGIDPGAIGLQVTTDGKPKVVDIVDCSGSGDVKMYGPVSAQDGWLEGCNGRKIRVNPSWNNPSGEYRVGLKNILELFPQPVKDRFLEKRKKAWQAAQTKVENQIHHSLQEAKDAEEYSCRVSLLQGFAQEKEDFGVAMDCIVYFDGERWQAAVDATGTGDMSSLESITNYNEFQQYRKLSEEEAYNYGVNIFDDGKLLSIVSDCGAHGTHVGGIIAANYPDFPAANGIAPGAQLVSLKIGDTRLGSMETGTSLIRALNEAVKRGCHMINMSYGEATSWDNEGVFIKIAEKLVYEHGIIFVSSAGNNGPCLSTVGCPGGTSTCTIGVGAYVTQSLMRSAYSLMEKLPTSNYTWSSVGPSLDGSMGVSIIAPGGAVTCVPNWTFNKKQLMNGTSMSSPNACGCIALLLSACKANNIAINPNRIRASVENSAAYSVNIHVLGQNHGLIQVQNAWKHLIANIEDSFLDIPIHFQVLSSRFSRGIYLRQPSETSASSTFEVKIFPSFQEQHRPEVKIHYEYRIQLSSTADWIKVPESVVLLAEGKTIAIAINPTELKPGVYVEFVHAIDGKNSARGPVFKIPITIIVPEVVNTLKYQIGSVELQPSERLRKFIVPPPGCTFIECKIADTRSNSLTNNNAQDNSSRLIVIHALQLFHGTPYRDNEKEVYIRLTPGSVHTLTWAVVSGVTMEFTIARQWATLETVHCTAELFFKGVTPSTSQLSIIGGQKVSEVVQVTAGLYTCNLAPNAKLDKVVSSISPSSSCVRPLGERDFFPDGTPLYSLFNEYTIELNEATSVTPRWPGLNGILYESLFHAQFYSIYSSNKRVVATGDAWPKEVSLKKGKYVVVFEVRHESPTILESLKSLQLLLEKQLSKPIKLTTHRNQSEAMTSVSKNEWIVAQGTSQSLVFKEPSLEQLPSDVSVGDMLCGDVTYLKKSADSLSAGTKPGGFPIKYFVTVTPSNGKKSDKNQQAATDSNESTPSESEVLEGIVKESKVKWLKSLAGTDSFDSNYATLSVDYGSDPLFKQLKLIHLSKITEKNGLENDLLVQACEEIVGLTDEILRDIDEDKLLIALNRAPTPKEKKQAEKLKECVLSCYLQKCLSIIRQKELSTADAIDKYPIFEESLKNLEKWDKIDTDKYWRLNVFKQYRTERWGSALKIVNDSLSKVKSPDNDNQKYQQLLKERNFCLDRLGWVHIKDNIASNLEAINCDTYNKYNNTNK